MKSRSLFVLAVGFGILIALIAVLGVGAIRRARTTTANQQQRSALRLWSRSEILRVVLRAP
jgi:hypothetical protein